MAYLISVITFYSTSEYFNYIFFQFLSSRKLSLYDFFYLFGISPQILTIHWQLYNFLNESLQKKSSIIKNIVKIVLILWEQNMQLDATPAKKKICHLFLHY